MDSLHWQRRLQALALEHGVVGASLAIAHGDTELTAATGVLNIRTQQPATPDALFQIGSITKVWTATLAMQLVDEGLLDLDTPVIHYLPQFRIQDAEITARVTPRQLLAHTSGIDGDLFLDTGRGDDALAQYVTAMSSLTRVVPPGQVMSYCNSGYSLLGHLIATLRGKTWEQLIRERLLRPLAATSAGTLPEEALLYGAASGHLQPAGTAEPTVTPQWALSRSAGPAGLIHSTAAQQLAFARLHLNGGVAGDGTRLLSAVAVEAMQQPQVDIPDPWLLGTHWGLGWILGHWGDQPVYGHDGTTFGQNAYLRILPGCGLAICLLSNGGRDPRALYRELFTEIGLAYAGVAPAPLPLPDPQLKLDTALYVGRYRREGMEVVIEAQDGRLVMTQKPKQMAGLPAGHPVFTLRAHNDKVLLMVPQGQDTGLPVVFFDREGQRYMHFGARTVARTA